ncbi:MAG: zinc ABC transporter substrate-binding protein [Comamonadaceae bacterium]|nr:zinc ABC transporter substrate-binding protein [Comamonadaceae bacterium]
MKRLRPLIAAAALCLAGSAQALTIFACEPEWAALARTLAPHAQVRSATHARQDPHHIEARPSLIAALRRADLAICTGAALESGWLPMLQQRAGNAKVQDGELGMLYAADEVSLIDPQPHATPGPFAGDVHPEGNPHLQLDPHRLRSVAQAIAARLGHIDPGHRDEIQRRWQAFDADWQQRIRAWEERARPLRGLRVATQHSTFDYLWRWLGVDNVADLEPQPGMPPTPGHLQGLLNRTRAQPPRAVVAATYQDPQSAQWLASQLGPATRLLHLPATVADDADASALSTWFDSLLNALLAVAPAAPSAQAQTPPTQP